MGIRNAIVPMAGVVATVGAALLLSTAALVATGAATVELGRPDPYVDALAIVTIIALVVFASAAPEDNGTDE